MKRLASFVIVVFTLGLAMSALFADQVTIGTGDQNYRVPVDMYYRASLYETLYYPDELGFTSGTITALQFYNNFVTDLMNMPIKIWLGTTNQMNLDAGWIPANQLTLVFDGNVNFPSGQNTISIQLNTPYMHTPGNLVMLVQRLYDQDWHNYEDNFLAQSSNQNRARSIVSDSADIDPFNPPASSTIYSQFPKTTITYTGQAIINDLACLSISGNSTPTVGMTANYVIAIKNNGSAAQSNYQVKLMQQGGGELASVNGLTIQSNQTLNVTVPWTPTTQGTISVYGSVVMTGDEFPQNNQTTVLVLNVQPEGIQSVTIGSGDQTARMPMDFYWRNSLFETLYYPDELGFVNGTITGIQFYNNFSTNNPNGATKIWLGTTTQQDLSTGYIPSTQLSLVFDGNVSYPGGQNNINITLTTPYFYTAGNLVMMVQRPMDGTYYSSLDYFLCQTIGGSRTRNIYSDSENYNPAMPPVGTLSGQFPKTSFFYTGDAIANDLGCLQITGSITPTAGTEYTYNIVIRNNGANPQSNYQVKLMQVNGGELASVNGPAINPQQTLTVNVPWTPTATGPMSIYGSVVLAGDEIPQNNQTYSMLISVQPQGVQAVTIGVGNQQARIPVDYWWRNSLYECLYYPDELGFASGTITAIQLYNQFTSNNPNGATKIWLGTTNLQDLAVGFIPSTQLTLVFDGNVSYPSGSNSINIPLTTPYFHTPGNLVLMVQRPMDASIYSSSDYFLCQTVGTNRARNIYSDSDAYNPASPPAGSLSGQFPKITFFYTGQAIQNDLGCFGISGNSTPTVGIASNYSIVIRNNGSNTQSTYQMKLMQQGGGELASVNGPAIAPQQTLTVSIPWTPATAGVINIYGTVVLTGDEIAQNNQTQLLQVNVQPEGIQAVTIGEGGENARYPMDFWMRNSLYECLYYPDELGFASGTITSIQFYNNFSTNNPNGATKIWMGSTNLQDLSGGYIPSTQLTQVFDGNVIYPSGQNNINIPLTTPYFHTPGNLVLLVQRPMDTTYYSSTDYFKCQTIGSTRARYAYSDSDSFNPSAPPAGTLTGQFPKTTLFYTGQAIENDLGCFSITGNITPTVGIASTYSVVIRNNGANPQSTYQVKMMQQGGGELASVNGPAINPQQTLTIAIPWTPSTAGIIHIYGIVVLTGDEIAQNNQTHPLQLNIQPEGIQAVTIGNGGQNARFPMDYYYRNSLYQTLYYPDELGFVSGTITSIQFYNNFSSNNPNGATKIWLGTTNLQDLSGGYIPSTQLLLVFDGNVNYPTGLNNINIMLTTPYFHTPGNLVLMVQRPMDTVYYSSIDYFICQTIGTSRARYAYSDSETYNPATPPTGYLTGQFPKTTLFYTGQAIENDLGCFSISGNASPTVGAPSPYIITIRNNGSQIQNNYQVKLFTQGDVEVASVAGPVINSLQTLEITINWTPTVAGTSYIYGKVVMAGDEIPQNNQTQNFNVVVNPAGVFTISVGNGSQDARVPVDMYWRNSLFETLYYPDEMSGFVGLIFGLKFYNNFSSNLMSMPIKIWLGTTTQTDLSGGWIPSTQLTLMYDGTADFPNGQNTISISFAEPFFYLNGENLVMMVQRPMDTSWHSSLDYFKAQSVGPNRALNIYSDSDPYDPAAPPTTATNNNQFPKTTFVVIPGGVGHINGTVLGAGNQPLAGVAVAINNGVYTTTTAADGTYQFINILPNTYTITFSKHGYHVLTQTIDLEEDETLTINVTLQLLPQVTLTGTILASDTGAGIPGAFIHLTGYESYNATAVGNGVFTIPAVYANHSYEYTIGAAGYTSQNGVVNVGNTNHNMGPITLNEVAFAPVGVTAQANVTSTAVNLSWLAPDPNALEITESFENETFPPAEWTRTVTNNGPPNAQGVYPTWCRVGSINVSGEYVIPTQGNSQAGLFWDYNHQDEWLITPSFNCPPSAYLKFDSYVFLGSTNQDHYYVKLTNDNGNTWIVLWDASAQTGGWNHYAAPITIDLTPYSGQQIKLAFQAVDGDNGGLWYVWFIDNIYIGNSITNIRFGTDQLSSRSFGASALKSASALGLNNNSDPFFGIQAPTRNISRAMELGFPKTEPRLPQPSDYRHRSNAHRLLTGYKVWRLPAGQETNESVWTLLTPGMITATELADSGWATLPNGLYRWAVRAIYTAGVTSVPSMSNVLEKFVQSGMIVGVVRNQSMAPIMGVTVTASGVSATTNAAGAYTLTVPVGLHSVTASKQGYITQTVEGVTVAFNQTTTQNFVLVPGSENEDELVPVTATALNGNFPNPFNPQTTISYSVKEPGMVSIQIYNLKGQLIRSLVQEEQTRGHYRVVWNGKDDHGKAVSSGIYLYRMSCGEYSATRRMVMMK